MILLIVANSLFIGGSVLLLSGAILSLVATVLR